MPSTSNRPRRSGTLAARAPPAECASVSPRSSSANRVEYPATRANLRIHSGRCAPGRKSWKAFRLRESPCPNVRNQPASPGTPSSAAAAMKSRRTRLASRDRQDRRCPGGEPPTRGESPCRLHPNGLPAAIDDAPSLERVRDCRRLVERESERRTLSGWAKQKPPRPVSGVTKQPLAGPLDDDRPGPQAPGCCGFPRRGNHEVGGSGIAKLLHYFDPRRHEPGPPRIQATEHRRHAAPHAEGRSEDRRDAGSPGRSRMVGRPGATGPAAHSAATREACRQRSIHQGTSSPVSAFQANAARPSQSLGSTRQSWYGSVPAPFRPGAVEKARR